MTESTHVVMLLDNPFRSDMRVRKEATSLVDAGFKVSIVCTQDAELEESETIDGIHIRRLLDQRIFHPLRMNFKSYVNEIAVQILELKPTIIHSHDFYTLEFGAAVKKTEPSIYLTYDTHEYFRKWLVYQDILGWFNRMKGYLVWRSLIRREAKNIHKCNTIIAAGEDVGIALKKDHKLTLNPINVRNVSALVPDPNYNSTLRSLLGIPDDHLIMVQSGNLYQNDDEVHRMIEETLEVPDVHFVFIGNRPRHYEVQEETIKRGWEKRVHFVDFNEKHLYNLLASADMGVMFMKTDKWLAHYYASSNRIMEYSAVGIPFLSVPQANSERLDKAFHNVEFFEPKSTGSFNDSIQRMILNLKTRTEGAKRVGSTLSWKSEFRVVIDLYKSISAGS